MEIEKEGLIRSVGLNLKNEGEKEGEEKKEKLYSHSKLWLFENCPEAYKIKYIDKTFPDLPKSAELFLGDMVHQSLEWLYKNANKEKTELDELIMHFANTWNSNIGTNIKFEKMRAENYFNKGIKFLIEYYQRHFPFLDNTIGIEEKIIFPLDNGGEYKIQGYVDRIVLNGGIYEIHDYKTNGFMKTQEQIDEDKQLAFYHIGLKEIFGKDIRVKLVWHFLAHDRIISSVRTDEQLENLKKETLELIKKIEANEEWLSCGKTWCDWCSYKKQNGS